MNQPQRVYVFDGGQGHPRCSDCGAPDRLLYEGRCMECWAEHEESDAFLAPGLLGQFRVEGYLLDCRLCREAVLDGR